MKINSTNTPDSVDLVSRIQRLYDDLKSTELDSEDLGESFYNALLHGKDGLKLIDFDNFNRNTFNVVTELSYTSQNDKFRPDITILVNGIRTDITITDIIINMDFYKSDLTNQSLSSDEYLELLGISNWVFQSNVGFIIEMIDKEHHNHSDVSWFELVEATGGKLSGCHDNKIKDYIGDEAFILFADLIERRNQIVHSLPTGTLQNNHPIMVYCSSRRKGSKFIEITDDFLKKFISDNNTLSRLIHKARGY